MPFLPPTMPLDVNIWVTQNAAIPPPYGAPTATVKGALRPLFTGNAVEVTFLGYTGFMSLTLPKGTDVRPWDTAGGWNTNPGSVVEVPAGSGRYYQVQMVDDVAKGFPNEYRFAIIAQAYLTAFPIP